MNIVEFGTVVGSAVSVVAFLIGWMSRRFDKIDSNIAEANKRIDATIASGNARFDASNNRMDTMINAINARLDQNQHAIMEMLKNQAKK